MLCADVVFDVVCDAVCDEVCDVVCDVVCGGEGSAQWEFKTIWQTDYFLYFWGRQKIRIFFSTP